MSDIIKINIEIPISQKWTCEGHKQLIEKTVNEAVAAIINIKTTKEQKDE